MPFRAVVFDLDGTLLNTLDDIAAAANTVLAETGFPTHPVESYREFIGRGVSILFQRALPETARDAETIVRCVNGFQVAYGVLWNHLTRPYDGIPALLDELTARATILTLLSNKPDDFTQQCARQYLAAWPFRVVIGASDRIPRKPDPTGVFELAAQVGLPPREFVYVGDSAVDMETATRAGMYPVGVSWGFRPVSELRQAGARAIIETPNQLLDLLDRESPLPGDEPGRRVL
ncbi:MAG: HAD family hydrolase [Isosphaeraceae bacterium]